MRFIVLLMLLAPSMAFAQERSAPPEALLQEARDMYQLGEEAYEQEEWAACAFYFERSFTLVFAPELLYNVGTCYDRAAHENPDPEFFDRAIRAYSRYLNERPGDGAAEILHRVEILRSMMHRVNPEANPPETRLSSTPNVEIDSEPERSVTSVELPEPPPVELNSPFGFTWTIVGAVATGIVGATALGLSISANSEFNSLAEGCGNTPEGCNPSDVSRLEALQLATNIMWGFSGVLLVSTGVAFAFEFSNQEGSPTLSSFGLSYTRSF